MLRKLILWIHNHYVFVANFVFTNPIIAEIRKNIKNILFKADYINWSGCERG